MVQAKLADNTPVALNWVTDYPLSGKVMLRVEPLAARRFPLHQRLTTILKGRRGAAAALLTVAAVLVVAFLYSSVGHAGASGYIAVMSLFSLAPAVIKPTALLLNILVASIGAWQFWRAGHFSWRLFWPFALLSIPAAFLVGVKVFFDRRWATRRAPRNGRRW